MKKKLLILFLVLGLMGTVSGQEVFYHMNDSSDPVLDYSGNDNDGSFDGAPTTDEQGFWRDEGNWASNESMNFLGDDEVETPTGITSSTFTYVVRVKSSNLDGSSHNAVIANAENNWLTHDGSDDAFQFYVNEYFANGNTATWPVTASDFNNNYDWVTLIASFDGTCNFLQVRDRKDNSLIHSDADCSGNPSYSPYMNYYQIGTVNDADDNQNDKRYFNGYIDEPAIFSRNLSSQEKKNYAAYNSLTAPNNPPSIDSVGSSPDPWTNTSKPDFKLNVTDDSSVSSVEADVEEDGSTIKSGVSLSQQASGNWTVTDLFQVDETNVWYNVTFTATDNDGATSTKEVNQYISDNSPTFNVASPENKTYGTQSLSWDLNETGDGDDVTGETLSVVIKEDGVQIGSDTITEGQDTTGSWTSSDGSHTFKAEVSESDGDTTTKTVDYEVDTGFGDINITDPAENSTTKDLSNISLKYTISNEPNLDSSSCQYSKDGGTNISISNCGNTTFQLGSVGTHNITLWAKDTLGNWGSDNSTWFADQENKINLTDKQTGSEIQDFQVTFDNGNNTLGGSTSNGEFYWLTSKAPKGSDVNVTLKAKNYVTKTLTWNITDSYAQDNTIQMERAGFTLTAYDEQDNAKLDKPVIVEMSNTTGGTKVFGLGNKYESQSGSTSNGPKAFDGDLGTSVNLCCNNNGNNNEVFGTVGLPEKSNVEVKVKASTSRYGNLDVQLYNTDTSSWDKIGGFGQDTSTTKKTFTVDNSGGEYNGRIELENFRDDDAVDVYEAWVDNYDKAEYNIDQVPQGDVAVRVDDIDYYDDFQSRTYDLTLDQYSKVSLRSYLLKNGEGIFMSVETLDRQGSSISGALVNIQRNLGGSWRTVSQKVTGTDGSSSFYLDPDIQYKAVASHPSYSTFEGTFSPTNYQYDPFQIQLGTKDKYNFSTRWDTVDYKLTPEDRFLNKSKTETIEWTVTDGQSDLTEFGLRLKYRNGTTIKTSKVQSSPSGGTVNISINGSQYDQGTEFKVEAYFLTGGDEYRIEKIYQFARSWTAGIFSLDKILDTNGDGLNDTPKGLFALIVTAVVGASLGKRFDKDGGGFIAVMVLGIFTIAKWFPFEIWTVTFLSLLGIYLYR